MRVRATRDGTYGGFYRHGPIDGVPGVSGGMDGEVFDIDEKPYQAVDPETGRPVLEPVLDARGNPIVETVMMAAVDERGNPVIGPDKKPIMAPIVKPRMKPRMWSWFAPEWMEKVDPRTPISYEENEGSRGVHPTMKIKKSSNQPQSFSELQAEVGKPIAEEMTI